MGFILVQNGDAPCQPCPHLSILTWGRPKKTLINVFCPGDQGRQNIKAQGISRIAVQLLVWKIFVPTLTSLLPSFWSSQLQSIMNNDSSFPLASSQVGETGFSLPPSPFLILFFSLSPFDPSPTCILHCHSFSTSRRRRACSLVLDPTATSCVPCLYFRTFASNLPHLTHTLVLPPQRY